MNGVLLTPRLNFSQLSRDPGSSIMKLADHLMGKHFNMQPIFHFDESFAGNAYGFRELTLAEMLCDPIVQDLMRSDGVSSAEVRWVFSLRRLRNLALAA